MPLPTSRAVFTPRYHDANFIEDVKRFHTIGCSAQTRNLGESYIQGKMEEAEAAGAFFRADTLEELADKLGFAGEAKETFLATVERYNELYDARRIPILASPPIVCPPSARLPSMAAGWALLC